MKPETEELAMLRHRWARTIEIWVAYQTFLNREIQVGEDKVCLNEIIAAQTTHTLLIAYYSFIYSLFDPSGTSFENITKNLLPDLPKEAAEARQEILKIWQKIKQPIQLIRHNIGFHAASKKKGADRGYQAYGQIHPFASETIMTLMRVFFRHLSTVYESSEPMANPPDPAITADIMQRAKDLIQFMKKTPTEDLMGYLMKKEKD